MEKASLIVGLGNPGSEYVQTRHNVGFMVLERLAQRWLAAWSLEGRFKASVARAEEHGRRVWLCRPQTYMNLSGEAVRAIMDYFQVSAEQLLVVVDDADLPLGELRLRPKGGAGGHHGLESIEQHLGTSEYARLRIGIGRQAQNARQLTGYVLGKFLAGERELANKVLTRATEQAACWWMAGIAEAMNKFNGAVEGP